MRSLFERSVRSGLLPSLLFFAVACQAGGSGGSKTQGSGASSSGGGSSSTSGSGNVNKAGSLSIPLGGSDTGSETLRGNIFSDAGAEITVNGEGKDVHLELRGLDDSPITEGVTWGIDDTKIGSISGDGTFHANGYVGGVVNISASVGMSSLSVALVVNVDITNAGAGVSEADKTALETGAPTPADSKFKFLYPQDKTVFPRGLASPELQLAGTAATATYTTITLPYFSYKQYSAGSTPTRISIPEPVWKGMTLTAGAEDDVALSVTKTSGGQVSGPVSQTYRIAQASMKGIIYYNTYSSPLTMGTSDADKGGILRIKAGGTAEVVTRGCRVCHAVSANGNVLAAGYGYLLPPQDNPPPDKLAPAGREYQPKESISYDLSSDGLPTPRTTVDNGVLFPFAGLTPDGAKALSNGLPTAAWPTKIMRGVYSTPGYKSQLLDTKTGQPITASGLTVNYVQTPSFSPDTKHVAFLNGDVVDSKRVLAMMDFDDATNTFSNMVPLVENTPEKAMAWPTFLPDASAIVYHEGDSFDSYAWGGAGTAKSLPNYAEVRMVEIATKTVKKLEALNGRDAAGKLVLPFGETVEGRMNYEPNVLPVAVGGYYWVIFDSRRTYGNTIAPGSTLEDVEQDPWGSDAKPSLRKKLWIAAIDVDHADSADPSHPAFYLPGQELEGGNMRAFAAMAPCQPDGGACESGSDCCGGFCRQTSSGADGAPMLECVPPPENTCSNTDEACLESANCCNSPKDICVNNRCTRRSPPK
jgi:hypothetical protein